MNNQNFFIWCQYFFKKEMYKCNKSAWTYAWNLF